MTTGIKPINGPVPAICIPIYSDPKTLFWRSYQRLWKPSFGSQVFGYNGATHVFEQWGVLITEARTIMTHMFLEAEPKATHMLMVDSDMVFPAHALKQLLQHDLPIVGGLCHNRRDPYQPILGKRHQDSDRLFGFCYNYPPNSLFEVDVTGAAFLLIKREVVEAISEKFGVGSWWQQYKGMSEDFSFCERAKECGYKVMVDTGLEIGHIAEVVITSETAKKLRPYQWDAWNPDPGMTPGAPLATVVIPTYNTPLRYLKAAVLSASHQSVPVEVIIVDDGSTTPVSDDGWPENVRVVHHNANRGIAAALNTGIELMKTNWFVWLSADDLLDPRKVQLQLSLLGQTGGKCSFTRWQAISTEKQKHAQIAPFFNWKSQDEQRAILGQACAVNGSTVMIHREVFEALGGFDEEYRYGQDWEFWCRVGERYFWFPLDEILTTRREHGNLTEAIETSVENDERRLRRDAEDASIKARYRWPR